MRVLITGIAGFAGSHLVDYLLNNGDMEIFGVCLPSDRMDNLAHCLDRITVSPLDLADADATRTMLDALQPDQVFHLAAQAEVGRAWRHPAETLTNNCAAEANLLQGIVDLALDPRILIVGSADEYGRIEPDDLPVGEGTPLRPLNPYAVSKIAQDFLGYQYYLSHHLRIVRVRPFNHIGPRQRQGFVTPDFASQIARIELGQQEPVIHVGNLTAERDFSDVRDIVRAYGLALSTPCTGQVYNLGSGHAHSIRGVLDLLISWSDVAMRVIPDPARRRPSDIPRIVCDSRLFREVTGWQPEHSFEESLRDVLTYWRQRVRAEA